MKQSPFRAIRQKLFNEGKLLRYLTYAIGEILLIIFGIMIALQLNNWNEDRKAQQEFEAYVVQLKADVQRVIDQNSEIAEFNRQHATKLYDIVTFLEGSDDSREARISFRQALRTLGRFRIVQLDVGHFGELLNGKTDVISRDPVLHQKTMSMISDIKVWQGINSTIEPTIVDMRGNLWQFFGQGAGNLIPGMRLRFDLEELRVSDDFLNITQNLITHQISMAGFMTGIVDELEEYLAEIEGEGSEGGGLKEEG